MRYFVAGLLLVGLFAVYACNQETPPVSPKHRLPETEHKPPVPPPQPTEDDGIIWRDSEGRIIH